jgi:hypothetical protein
VATVRVPVLASLESDDCAQRSPPGLQAGCRPVQAGSAERIAGRPRGMQSPDPSDPACCRPTFMKCLLRLQETHDEPVRRISEWECSDGAACAWRVRGRVDLVWCDPRVAGSGHRCHRGGESAARPRLRRCLCRHYRGGDLRTVPRQPVAGRPAPRTFSDGSGDPCVELHIDHEMFPPSFAADLPPRAAAAAAAAQRPVAAMAFGSFRSQPSSSWPGEPKSTPRRSAHRTPSP